MKDILLFVETHGVAIVITGIVLFFGYSFGKIELDYWRQKRKGDAKLLPDEQMQIVLKVTPEIKSVLREILLQTHSSRAYIFQFHNGSYGFGGQPFIYMSNTYEILSGTAVSQHHARQNMPFTLYDSLVTGLINNDTIVINPKSKTKEYDEIVYETMEKRGNILTICTKLVDEHKKMVGFVGVDYCKNSRSLCNNEAIQDIIKIVFKEAQILGTLLCVKVQEHHHQ